MSTRHQARWIACSSSLASATLNPSKCTRVCLQVVSTRHDDGVLVLHGKLERKHEVHAVEKARMAAETKKIRFEQMQQAAGASQVGSSDAR